MCASVGGDHQLRRSVCAAGQPACPQVSRSTGLSGSDRDFPALTGRSGTQRARRPRLRTIAGTLASWSSSPPRELHITSGFSCDARGLKPRASFRSAGCYWWRLSAVDGGPGTSRGHAWRTAALRLCPACALTRTFRPVGSSRHRLAQSAHPPGSGPGPPGPAGAPYWTNDLDLEGLVCSALPGRTVMGEPATYLSCHLPGSWDQGVAAT